MVRSDYKTWVQTESKLSLSVGLSVCPSISPFDFLKMLASFTLSVFGHRSHGTASLSDHHENHLI
jgi:hypothetical protein